MRAGFPPQPEFAAAGRALLWRNLRSRKNPNGELRAAVHVAFISLNAY
jgi:hypothetical protein